MKTPIYAVVDEANNFNVYLALYDDFLLVYSLLLRKIKNELFCSQVLKNKYIILAKKTNIEIYLN